MLTHTLILSIVTDAVTRKRRVRDFVCVAIGYVYCVKTYRAPVSYAFAFCEQLLCPRRQKIIDTYFINTPPEYFSLLL